MTPSQPSPRDLSGNGNGWSTDGTTPVVAPPAAGVKPLTFSACAGEVIWRAGGPAVFLTPAMIDQLTDDLTQEGIDGALHGDVEHVRRATKLLNELQTACRSARQWREAALAMTGGAA